METFHLPEGITVEMIEELINEIEAEKILNQTLRQKNA